MTEAQARTTANVVLATAVIGAAYYVLKTPPLRRRVWQIARSWAAGPLAAWTATEIRRAWEGSASTSASGRLGSSAGSSAATAVDRPTYGAAPAKQAIR
jgi:hypothetical protein